MVGFIWGNYIVLKWFIELLLYGWYMYPTIKPIFKATICNFVTNTQF